MLGALRAACDEMGVVLVRSAHSANIKERRDASTALFDARGQMVMQAEHIPVHLGAMPRAVAAVLDEEHAPGRRLDPQRPLPRRHPPAGHHGDLARVPRRRAGRLRRQPRPPRRRRRRRAGQHAGRLAHARGGGRGDPADAGSTRDDARASCAGAQMRNPRQREADLRAQLAANRAGAERVAELVERYGLDDAARGDGARRSTTPSGAPARAIAELDDGERDGDRRARGAPTATSSCGCGATVDGDELTLDFTGSAAQHDGNLNCPLAVTLSACYFAAARAHRPRRAAVRGRLPPDRR